jgi:hypothetical protein
MRKRSDLQAKHFLTTVIRALDKSNTKKWSRRTFEGRVGNTWNHIAGNRRADNLILLKRRKTEDTWRIIPKNIS